MQIGEFAMLCGTKISVLRHYDKEGLLSPDHVDRFTGYRYYAKEQISVFFSDFCFEEGGLFPARDQDPYESRGRRASLLA